MTAPVYKTLGEMRASLSARCGFGAAGAAAGVNAVIIKDFLQTAQTILYNTHDWVRLRRYVTVTLGADATLIDYPTGANPERIKAISALRGNVWSKPLPRGISPQMYTYQSLPSWPQRWEPYDQIEIWPLSDQAYSMRIFYIKSLDRFTQDADRCTIDDGMVYLLAIAHAKAHYRQPDAALYGKQADTLVSQLKAKSWSKDVFNPNEYQDEALIKPQVTSDLGY